jgi:hypothetical protein
MKAAVVVAVHRKSDHSFSKDSVPAVELIAGHGVQVNLRQVHLLHAELV